MRRSRARASPPSCRADADAIEVTKSKRSEPRIPFGWVVERGLLPPGTVLHGTQKRHRAKVRADGTLVCADATGSIHQIGAHVQGLDACNGWTFWQYEDKGNARSPIDVLRQRLRADLLERNETRGPPAGVSVALSCAPANLRAARRADPGDRQGQTERDAIKHRHELRPR